jgi:hypothetical protein
LVSDFVLKTRTCVKKVVEMQNCQKLLLQRHGGQGTARGTLQNIDKANLQSNIISKKSGTLSAGMCPNFDGLK